MDKEIEDSELYLRRMPVVGGFEAPKGYFEALENSLMSLDEDMEKRESSISMQGFGLPNNYFEKLEDEILAKVETTKGAKLISLKAQSWYLWASSAAAVFLIVLNFVLFEPKLKSSEMATQNLSAEEIADHLQDGDISEDLLCDAGWCVELERLSGADDKATNDLLFETEEEILINEL